MVLHGILKLSANFMIWTVSDDPKALKPLSPGKLLIRVHCASLFDQNNMPFSAVSAVLAAGLGIASGPLFPWPGGIFESWVLIA